MNKKKYTIRYLIENKRIILMAIMKSLKRYTVHLSNKKFYGTEYGGWFVYLYNEPQDKVPINIISAGVGEDMSFDIEMSINFNSNIILVDPTPRSIIHYDNFLNNLETIKKECSEEYSYLNQINLNKFSSENFVLSPLALEKEDNKEVRFFEPENEEHVSHSVVNWQKVDNARFIRVKTVTVKKLMETFNLSEIEILKLDIEGSEVNVLNNMFKENIYPNQLLIEFDIIRTNKLSDIIKFYLTIKKIIKNDYINIEIDRFPHFLFVRKEVL